MALFPVTTSYEVDFGFTSNVLVHNDASARQGIVFFFLSVLLDDES